MIEAANITAVARREENRVETARLDDRVAKAVAVLVFALGVSLLVAVFFWTKDWFEALARANEEWLRRPVAPEQGSAVNDYAPVLTAQALRAVLLFVMGYLASSVATKGAQLFAAASSRGEAPRDVP